MDVKRETKIDFFEDVLLSTKRDGMEGLLDYIRKSDFYTAPASTRFHGSYEGGLLDHSLNVYDRLTNKFCVDSSDSLWSVINKEHENYTNDTLAIVSLLHDICKTYYYDVEMRNKKVYSDAGSKTDNKGRYDWQSVPVYIVNDKIPYGHGEKSVMIIERFIKLTNEERFAIRWHMGAYEPKENWNTLSEAIDTFPLVLALHEADMEATHFMDITPQ